MIFQVMSKGRQSTVRTILLTYFLDCIPLMLLNKTSRHRGNIPWSCGVPVIVYVFPDDVIPYVNNKPDKQINNKTSMIRTEMAGSP